MKTFDDKEGRSWTVDVDGDTIARVETATGLLLTDLIGGPAADAIAASPTKLLAVLYAVCKPQADARDVSEAAFRSLFNGDAVEAATEALTAEVIAFFPKARRPLMQKLTEKGREVQALAMQRAMKALEETTAANVLAKAAANSSGVDSGNLPESSESTQGGSLSAD